MVDQKKSKLKEKQMELDFEAWNRKEVAQMTGLTAEMVRETVGHMAEFIKQNLVPNHMHYFDLGKIKGVKNVKIGKYFEV